MKEVFTITQAKARLSELISRLIHQKNKIVLTKKGKRVAVMMPFEEYQKLEKGSSQGLLLAQNALADIDEEIDAMCDRIYRARESEKTREVPL